jgi:hypothetical protein
MTGTRVRRQCRAERGIERGIVAVAAAHGHLRIDCARLARQRRASHESQMRSLPCPCSDTCSAPTRALALTPALVVSAPSQAVTAARCACPLGPECQLSPECMSAAAQPRSVNRCYGRCGSARGLRRREAPAAAARCPSSWATCPSTPSCSARCFRSSQWSSWRAEKVETYPPSRARQSRTACPIALKLGVRMPRFKGFTPGRPALPCAHFKRVFRF